MYKDAVAAPGDPKKMKTMYFLKKNNNYGYNMLLFVCLSKVMVIYIPRFSFFVKSLETKNNSDCCGPLI